MSRPAIDVSGIPTFAFGSRSILWWGTLSIMVVEGSMFVFAMSTYFYLQGFVHQWPPGASRLPGMTFATINTAILLISAIPNQWLKKKAEHLDLGKVRIGLLIADGFALAFLIVRGFEFAQLSSGIRWDSNAYGSILWTLLGLHTAHLLTDFFDTAILTAMSFLTPFDGKRFVDVSENCLYWDFVVIAWIPIYLMIYVVPRL